MTKVERATFRMTLELVKRTLLKSLVRYDGDNNDHPPEENFGWFWQIDDVTEMLDIMIGEHDEPKPPSPNEHNGVKLIGDDD